MSLAPIVLFAFDRPHQTRKTLEALAKNDLASRSHLIIYCDGEPNGAHPDRQKDIREVREVIRSEQWCKTVQVIESDCNRGLANSIVSGVSEVVREFGKVIVLEDDILTSKGFLTYMNSALTLYEDDPSVFQVSGFMVPSRQKLPQTGFFRAPASWGWATWSRAWQHYVHDLDTLQRFVESSDKTQYNLEGTYEFSEQLAANIRGEMNTWVVRFYTSMLMQNALCLYPYRSLTRNIGFGGGATNTTSTHPLLKSHKLVERLTPSRLPIIESLEYYNAYISFYRKQQFFWAVPSSIDRWKIRAKNALRFLKL